MQPVNKEVGATIIRLLTDIDDPSDAVDVLTGVMAIVFSVLPVQDRKRLKALTETAFEAIGDTLFEDGEDFEDFVQNQILGDLPDLDNL